MTASDAAAAIDALGAAFLTGDPDAVMNHFAGTGDVIYAGSEPGEVAVGKDAIRPLLETLFSRAERYSWRITSVSAGGNDDTMYVVADAELTVHAVTLGGPVGPAERASAPPCRDRGRPTCEKDVSRPPRRGLILLRPLRG